MAFPQGGDNEPILEMIARITADSSDFVKEVKEAADFGEEKISEMGDEMAAAIDKAMERLGEAAKKGGKNFVQIFKENQEVFREMFTQTATSSEDAAVGIARLNEEVDSMVEGLQKMTPLNKAIDQVTESLGGFFRQFGIPALVLGTLNEIQKFFKEGIRDAIEYTDVLRKFEIQVHQLQRTQGEAAGTVQEWYEFSQKLTEEFGTETPEMIERMSLLISRLNSDMSLNKDQMMELIRAGEILDRTNINNANSAEQLADFIQRGSVDALENLGLSFSEATFQAKAYELGIDKLEKDMSEQEKQLVRLNLVLDQTNMLAGDAASLQDTLAGRMKQANEDIESQGRLVGKFLAPAWVWLKEKTAEALEMITTLVQIWVVMLIKGGAAIIASFIGVAAAYAELQNQLESGNINLPEIGRAFAEGTTEAFQQLQREGVERFMELLSDLSDSADVNFDGVSQSADKMAEDVGMAFDKVSDAIEDAMRRWEEGVADAQLKLQRRELDIARDAQRRQRDLQQKLNQDLSDMARDAARKKQDAIKDAQDKEIKLREDFLDDIKELENKYLFDLEDAVRERDARKVLDLLRRMNEEKKKREKDFKDRQKELKQNLKDELDQIDENLARQREKRLLAYQREMEDLRLATQRKLDDARMAYQRQLQDLETSIRRRLELVANGIAGELTLTAQGLQLLYDQLNGAFGPNGWVEAFYAAYAQIIASAGQKKTSSTTQSYSGTGSYGGGGGLNSRPLAYARGTRGHLAMSEELLRVGERPELVTVTPLGGGGQPLAGFGGKGQVQVAMRVSLGDGLVAEIIDQTMDDFADVLVDIENG
jgi:hypothetical protein